MTPTLQGSGSEAIIQPYCVQHVSHVRPSRARLQRSCARGTNLGDASAPSSVPNPPNVTRLPHLKRQDSWGCSISPFSSSYQQLQELWPLTSCQKGLQPAPVTQPTVGLGWESPDLGVTCKVKDQWTLAGRALQSVDTGFRSSLQKLSFMTFLWVPSLAF